MSVSADLISKSFGLTLIRAVPCLKTTSRRENTLLATLVERYLFPEPKNWITEWTGPHGYDVVSEAFSAQKILPFKEAALVVQYLQKSDMFGLADLEKAAGGKEELRKLLGTYGDEKPLPLEIDDEMQALFFPGYNADEIACAMQSRAEFSSDCPLFWCPRGMTPFIAQTIAQRHDMQFAVKETDRLALSKMFCRLPPEVADLLSPDWVEILYGPQEDHLKSPLYVYGDTPALCDYWIAFPNQGRPRKVIRRTDLPFDSSLEISSKWLPTDRELRMTLPPGWEFPNLIDAVFSVFGKYVYTRKHYHAKGIEVRTPYARTPYADGVPGVRRRFDGAKQQTDNGTYAFCRVDSGRWIKLSRGLAPNTLRLAWVASEARFDGIRILCLPCNLGDLVAVRKYV